MDKQTAILISATLFSVNKDSQFFQDQQGAIEAATELYAAIEKKISEDEYQAERVQEDAKKFIAKQNMDKVSKKK